MTKEYAWIEFPLNKIIKPIDALNMVKTLGYELGMFKSLDVLTCPHITLLANGCNRFHPSTIQLMKHFLMQKNIYVISKNVVQGFDDAKSGMASFSDQRRNRCVLMLEMRASPEFNELFKLVYVNEKLITYNSGVHPHTTDNFGNISVHMTVGILKDEFVDRHANREPCLTQFDDTYFELNSVKEIVSMWN